jgi:GT2 family glycosyltransferase
VDDITRLPDRDILPIVGFVQPLTGHEADRQPQRRLGQETRLGMDKVVVSPDGYCFLAGVLNTADYCPIRKISVYDDDWALLGATLSVARCRPTKKENQFGNLAGFWAIVPFDRPVDRDADTLLTLSVASDNEHRFLCRAANVNSATLRDVALDHLANPQYYSDATVEAFFQLDNGVGQSLIDLNCSIVARIVKGAYRLRFGTGRASYLATVIVCLYGKPEYLMLQAALFSQCPGYDRYEFIYVSNSPELSDTLASDAAIASQIYGVDITLILMPDNAGFGVANNVAAAAAQTDRLLFVNPDVLPRDPKWPQRHADLVRNLPPEQVTLFGTSLYYDDGSLMHGGMYIDVDGPFTLRDGKMVRRDVLRVEHYGKGAPSEGNAYRNSRAVPAVSGAFLSIDRAWFEKLNGFSPSYIFGHYEDVDLCLRSLQAGQPAWLHDVPFWHLESKGSNLAAAHVGGRLVNRWLMTSTWSELVKTELNGRNPARFSRLPVAGRRRASAT